MAHSLRIQKMDEGGRITIPKEIRDLAGIKDGACIFLSVTGKGKIVMNFADDEKILEETLEQAFARISTEE